MRRGARSWTNKAQRSFVTVIPTAAGLAARLACAELERRNIDPTRLPGRAGLSAAASSGATGSVWLPR